MKIKQILLILIMVPAYLWRYGNIPLFDDWFWSRTFCRLVKALWRSDDKESDYVETYPFDAGWEGSNCVYVSDRHSSNHTDTYEVRLYPPRVKFGYF